MSNNQKYFTESQVAEMLCISVKKLQSDRLMRIGMPFFKIGKSVRYSIEDINDWMQKQKISYTENNI